MRLFRASKRSPDSSKSRRRRKLRAFLIWLAIGAVIAAAFGTYLLLVNTAWRK